MGIVRIGYVGRRAVCSALLMVPIASCAEEWRFQPEPETFTAATARIAGTDHVIASVDSTFFGIVQPLIGRRFVAEDYAATPRAVAALSHAFWMEHFAGQPGVIGSSLEVDGVTRTIVAVMPQDIALPEGVVLWIPRRDMPEDARRP